MDKMNNNEIRSFSLEELVSHASDKVVTYYEGCALGHLHGNNDHSMFHTPVRIDAFVICICSSGETNISSNITRNNIGKNTMFFHKPENIISINDSTHSVDKGDLELDIIAFSQEFMRKLNIDIKQLVPMTASMSNISRINLTDLEVSIITATINSARRAISHFSHYKFYHEIVRRILEVLLYTIFDIISRYADVQQRATPSVKSRNEEYFSRFAKVLQENYKSERSVSFYASQLHITPKYLTTVIRNVSGRSAAAWIDEYVILEAKNLLKYSTMSIQEVAYSLNFPNQSFFGKYFKHHTGYSPSQFRLME